uniref:Coiled-coil domain-containing protein 86 n=1 Tax=Dunaliella tertiolecta TaxID=3047 RepID=A0A7S3R0S3_DUNTE|mmetsp:Transcript_27544/g.74526  ORF Transcript_27544/g.74526 Transcript_27544/m.74526 type:complete len:206 (+) Transcript_27544:1826-2443(+)|eukprot:CAMPEP_0202353562 /NCGR_PEP_ID=MMETSP1126-20121109/9270_1 /ASSEMBLY_ACC=CAM_ASM_000457 /TAXON_ID=3047 /ORGANISM="Dunaliella tertiolecta, Strain CCMP1320" /LENGTH=205 /DNA_ID=CAMNT_0048945929 /DNA_START=61 /DNA_END=678 /DNA_ORIENTATION=-
MPRRRAHDINPFQRPAQDEALDNWQPAQHAEGEAIDLRNAKLGPKGFKERGKRKLEQMEESHAADLEEAANRMQEDGDLPPQEEQPSSKRRKAGQLGFIPVSGRTWKAPARRAGEVMKPQVGSSWEKKMQQRASRQQFLDFKREAVEAAKEKRKAAAKQKKEALERKKANQAKSEVVQKISNSSTVKKMMKNKKQKGLLRTADTN